MPKKVIKVKKVKRGKSRPKKTKIIDENNDQDEESQEETI